ncbi:hypothetical protein JG688_00000451 [Phytophthora aleatoria]|uniref:Uncharacterized protein n=1 Tax=Phytophthora aleatoria TaxID=2496075 RepID=A0A8J5JC51_9STRA|nr:hypothetical protein JG688_00000451 [Phytophthora aleatoria]
MWQVKVKKVLRMDHSVKFCKRLKVCSPQGQQVGRRLTPSENHEETEKLLLNVKTQFAADGDCFVVSDNANAVRKLIGKSYGDSDVNRELRAPKDMETCLRDVLAKIDIEELSCTEAEWNGCIESNTPQYRSATPLDFSFKTWQTIFKSARVHPEVFKANLTRSRQHFTSIKELLMKNATAPQTGSVDRRVFMPSLRLNDNACEGATGFSAEEYKLLRQLRREQKATGRSWAASALVTTVMFNLVVSTNSNSQLKLRRRSIRTLETALKTV